MKQDKKIMNFTKYSISDDSGSFNLVIKNQFFIINCKTFKEVVAITADSCQISELTLPTWVT